MAHVDNGDVKCPEGIGRKSSSLPQVMFTNKDVLVGFFVAGFSWALLALCHGQFKIHCKDHGFS